MKVLILTGIFPPDIGGPATQLDYLIRDLIKRGFEISVLTFGKTRTSDVHPDIGGPYPVKKISKKIPQPWRNFFYLLRAFLMSFGFEAIYAWDLYTAGFSGFLIKKFFPKKKFIIRFAGDSAWEDYVNKSQISNLKSQIYQFDDVEEFQDKKYGLRIKFRKLIRKKIITSADKVVAVSFFLAGIAEKIGVKKEKIKVIYNSVDFLFEKKKEVSQERCRELGFKGINIVSASRLVPWKGQAALIEIMPDLIARYKDIYPQTKNFGMGVYLWIIGEGPEKKNLEFRIQNLELGRNVFLTGGLSHTELFEHMSCADIFVLNTGYEGLSHTILEAMHIGIPIVTTNICSNPEIIQNKKSGFLVEYNNKEELKKAISELIDQPEAARSFASEAKKNLERFKWENLVEETAAILRN